MHSQRNPRASVAIDREQRDAIYADLMTDLSGVGDISVELDGGDVPTAQRLRREYEDDLRLLDDLGWTEEVSAESFELTQQPDALERTIRRLRESAIHCLAITTVDQKEEQDAAQRHAASFSAYECVLTQLVEGDKREEQ